MRTRVARSDDLAMSTNNPHHSGHPRPADALDAVINGVAGIGILLVALFPFSIPMAALVVVPLVLVLLALGLVAGVLAAPAVAWALAARVLGRRRRAPAAPRAAVAGSA